MVDDITVDNLYNGYELTFVDDDDEDIDVYCTRCEKSIGELEMNDVKSLHSKDLFEVIIDLHKEVGV